MRNESCENANSETALVFPADYDKVSLKFHAQLTPHHAAGKQGCQVVISKKGVINPWKKSNSTKKAKCKIITQRHLQTPKRTFEKQYMHIIYIKRIKLTKRLETFGLINISKRLVFRKCKNETAKLRIVINSRAIFHSIFIILCPETVSRNLPVPRNLPKSSLYLPNRHKNSNWAKKAKKPGFICPFSKNRKKTKEVKIAKHYKFVLKKAKLETLLVKVEAEVSRTSFTIVCDAISRDAKMVWKRWEKICKRYPWKDIWSWNAFSRFFKNVYKFWAECNSRLFQNSLKIYANTWNVWKHFSFSW